MFCVDKVEWKTNVEKVLHMTLLEETEDELETQFGHHSHLKTKCPINFKLSLHSIWCKNTWVDQGDFVRVIGTFSAETSFHLTLSLKTGNNQKGGNKLATMLVVEPLILIPVTTIVGASDCARDTMLKRDYKDDTRMRWPTIFGNIIHEVFQ